MTEEININTQEQTVPAKQVIFFTIKRLNCAIAMLESIEKKWHQSQQNNKDGSKLRTQSRVLVDVITVYVSALVDTRNGCHSLVNSFPSNKVIDLFKKLPIVKKCKLYRNNRIGHESVKFGFTISPDEILKSDIKQLVCAVEIFIINHNCKRL